MRIGLDYTAAIRQRAGIGRYTRGIVSGLAQLDQSNTYALLISRDCTPDATRLPAEWPRNTSLCRLPFSERTLTIAWHRLHLPLYVELFAGALDVFHAPDFVLPPVRRARTIVTVHDLSFLRFPECADRRLVTYLTDVVPRSLRRADLVLADSASTGNDLVTLLNVPPKKISVVPAGVSFAYHPITDRDYLAAVRARYNLPQRFVLSVGTLEPRKNLVRLIEAMSRLAADEPDLHLVLVGSKGWLYQDIFAAVERSGLSDRVHLPGHVAEEDLPAVYNLAAVFAFPSLYEGFGLPPLEALACGVPVVCSDSSSLPEVVGDAALLIPASDTAALADAISRLLHDDGLRETLRSRGLERARGFTWQAAAHQLLHAYQSLCASP